MATLNIAAGSYNYSDTHCSFFRSSLERLAGSSCSHGQGSVLCWPGELRLSCCRLLNCLALSPFPAQQGVLPFLRSWAEFGGGRLCRAAEAAQDLEVHVGFSTLCLCGGERMGQVLQRVCSALKFPFEAAEKHFQPRGMNWK